MQKTTVLSDSKTDFSTLFQAISIPLVVFRLVDGKILYVNEYYYSRLKLARNEISVELSLEFYRDLSQREILLEVLLKQGYLGNVPLKLNSCFGEKLVAIASLQLLIFHGEQTMIAIFHQLTSDPYPTENLNPLAQHLEQVLINNEDINITRTERQRAEEEIRLLQKMIQAIAAAEDFNSIMEVALKKICETTGWDYGEAWIPSSDGKVLESSPAWYSSSAILKQFRQPSELFTFAPGVGLPGWVWLYQKPNWLPNVSLSPESVFPRVAIAQQCGLKAGFAVPIIADNQVLAVLTFFMFKACEQDKRLVDLVSCVAAQLGSVIKLKQTEVALQAAEAKYRSIFENATEGIFQTSPDGRYISANPALAYLYGYSSPAELIQHLTDIENQLYVQPGRRDEFAKLLQENGAVAEFESEVYRADGSITWIAEKARAVRDQNGNLLYYEGTVEDITVRKQVQEKLQEKAFYDNLTGLPNRALFMERLRQVIDSTQEYTEDKFALLFLDLDGFKAVNDTLGHLIGDKLLIEIARRLETCVRSHDTVARLAGDEFTILLRNIHDLHSVTNIAERINKKLKVPFYLNGHEVLTATSIGIVISSNQEMAYTDQQQETAISCDQQVEILLHNADKALYRAKMLGKGCYQVFGE